MIEPFLYSPLPFSKREPVWKRQSGDEALPSQVPCEPHCSVSHPLIRAARTTRCWWHFLIVCGLPCAYYRLDTPPFVTTQRAGFDNLHHVTDVTTVLFIVSQNLFRFPDDLFVKRMLKASNQRHCDSFIHIVTRDKTCPKFAMSSSFLAQLYPPNQSKLIKYVFSAHPQM